MSFYRGDWVRYPRQPVNWQVPSVVGRPWLVAFSVLLRSPALAFRNGRDKELEVAEQWDLISLGSTTYLSAPSRFHADDDDGERFMPTSPVCCAHGLPNGVQLSLKNSPRQTVSFFPHLPLFPLGLWINVLVLANARDVINPRRWRWGQTFMRKLARTFLQRRDGWTLAFIRAT